MRGKDNISLDSDYSRSEHENYFKQVYNEYFDRLFAFALVITKSEDLAKDVVSDVFYNLWKSNKDLFTIRELKSYLFTSTKNQAIRTLSCDPQRFTSDRYNHLISSIDQVDPEELMVGKELDQFLIETIEKLPPQCRQVFKMVKIEDMKYSEVANALGISNNTVKYHIKSALEKLRVELNIYFKEPKLIKWISNYLIVFFIPQFYSMKFLEALI